MGLDLKRLKLLGKFWLTVAMVLAAQGVFMWGFYNHTATTIAVTGFVLISIYIYKELE